jgi:hydrogenase maturation factor
MAQMTIDDLASAIARLSPEAVVQRLAQLLNDWKRDPSTVEQLSTRVDRYIGNTWIADEAIHAQVHKMWSEFRAAEVQGIGGMTMNERLFSFGLFAEFDNASTDEQRIEIYAKLHAKP